MWQSNITHVFNKQPQISTLQKGITGCRKDKNLIKNTRLEKLEFVTSKVYIPLTAHLGIILVNNHPDAFFSMYLFISLLYMFRATQCSSSGESNCINTSSGIYHCAWYAGPSGLAYQAVTYTE